MQGIERKRVCEMRTSGETRICYAYRICETFADFSLERVKASVTKHDECDFLMLVSVCPVSSTGGVPLAMVSSKLGHWTRGINRVGIRTGEFL